MDNKYYNSYGDSIDECNNKAIKKYIEEIHKKADKWYVSYDNSGTDNYGWDYDTGVKRYWGVKEEESKEKIMSQIKAEEISIKELRAELKSMRADHDKLIEKKKLEDVKIAKASQNKYTNEYKLNQAKLKEASEKLTKSKEELKKSKKLLSETEKEVNARTKEMGEIIKQIEFTEGEITKREDYNERKHREQLDWIAAQNEDIAKRKKKLKKEHENLDKEMKFLEKRRQKVLGTGAVVFATSRRVVELDLDPVETAIKKDEDAPLF